MAGYYIDPTSGDNANGGTSTSDAWETIAYAYDNSAVDDTLYLMPGTHSWVVDTILSRTLQGVDSDGNLATDPAVRETILLDAGDTNANVVWQLNAVTINDITIQNNGGYNYAAIGQINGLFTGNSAASVMTFNRCVFRQIRLDIPDSYDIVKGLTLFGHRCETVTLNNCKIYDVSCSGINGVAYLFAARFSPNQNLTMNKCTIYTDATGLNALDGLIYIFNSAGVTTTITNCIISNKSGESFQLSVAVTHTLTHNCLYEVTQDGTIVDGGGNITSDPLLDDPSNGVMTVAPNSPVIRAGIPT